MLICMGEQDDATREVSITPAPLIRVQGLTFAEVAIDLLLLFAITTLLLAGPLVYLSVMTFTIGALPIVKWLMIATDTSLFLGPLLLKAPQLLGMRFDDGVIEVTGDRVIAVAIGQWGRVRREFRISEIDSMGFVPGSRGIYVWSRGALQPALLLTGLNPRGMRRAAEELHSLTGWPRHRNEARRPGSSALGHTPTAPGVDFRANAVDASRKALAAHGQAGASDFTACDSSLCLPAPGNPDACRRDLWACSTTSVSLLLGGIAGAVCAAAHWGHPLGAPANGPSASIPGLCAAGLSLAVGFTAMFSAVALRNRVFLRYLRTQADLRPKWTAMRSAGVVSVEDMATVSTLKWVDDDVAAVFADPHRRIIVLEGYSHRYLIRAQDLVEFYSAQLASMPFVVVAFRVGGSAHVLRVKLAQVVPLARSPLDRTLQSTFQLKAPLSRL